MPSLAPSPKFKANKTIGLIGANLQIPLAGAKLYAFAAGTTTPKDTYINDDLSVPNTNPVVTDVNGEANVWLGLGAYKFLLTDAAGVVQPGWPIDNIVSIDQVEANAVEYTNAFKAALLDAPGSTQIGFVQQGPNAIKRTLQDEARSRLTSRQFGVSGTKSASYNRGALQAAVLSGEGLLEVLSTRAGEIILIDGAIDVPAQMEIIGTSRWATAIRSTALNQPIFRYAAGSHDCSLRSIHLSYQGTPAAGGNAIELNGCQTFDAKRIWIDSCYNGLFMSGGGNHSFDDIRIFGYESTGCLVSASINNNLSNFLFDATNSLKGLGGGIRLQGGVESFKCWAGDVQRGVYGITTADFGSQDRGAAPYYNHFSKVYFDSQKSYAAQLTSLAHTDFSQCWFASTGHDEAVGYGSALPVDGVFMNQCSMLDFVSSEFNNCGGRGAIHYATNKFIRFLGNRFQKNQFSRTVDADALGFLAGSTDFTVLGNSFERVSDTTNYRQVQAVNVLIGASDRYHIKDNLLGGCTVFDGGTGTTKSVSNNY